MFKDKRISEELLRKGFALLDADLLPQTEWLHGYLNTSFTLPDSQFYYSLMANSVEGNLRLRNTIRQRLQGFYDSWFMDFRILTESFLSKPGHSAGELLLHQDWCYTDEREFRAYNIWIPLCDVDEHNGALFFLPGSHTWFHNYRSGSLPTGRIATADLPDLPIQVVPMKKGQALLFHPAVFHGSLPNHTAENRMVVTATLMAQEAPFLYYHKEGEREVRVFELEDDALLRGLEPLAMGGMPQAPEYGRLAYTHELVTAKDLRAKAAHHDQ